MTELRTLCVQVHFGNCPGKNGQGVKTLRSVCLGSHGFNIWFPVRKLGDGRESAKVRSICGDGEEEHFIPTAVCSVFEVGLVCNIVLLSEIQQNDSVTPTQIHSSSYPP